MKIGLVGNPNVGKTTLFNSLTGANQYVGNWPGVTVEKKVGKLKKKKDIEIVDLPGIYSLSPYTSEEVVSRDFLLNENVDLIINIVDVTNLERNLFLTTQLLELNIPMILALNMSDLLKKDNIKIDIKAIESSLGVKCVEISALKNKGIDELIFEVSCINNLNSKFIYFDDDIEKVLIELEKLLPSKLNSKFNRWYAIKLFEKDQKIISKFNIDENKIDILIQDVLIKLDDDGESLINTARYLFINDNIDKFIERKNSNKVSLSDKIDKIVTNRFLALPIFILVMWVVYYVSVSSLGTIVTDWTNDVLFGEIVPNFISNGLNMLHVSGWLKSLVLDGIVAGVGAVLGFVPQLLILFFFLSILEECGYMSRVAFIMDRIFRRFGLSGKSFIPMLIGTGCSVPGIMASRTIENEANRRMTIMTTSFIPCGAKLPIIALISGAMFGGASWIAPSCYFLGIVAVICSGVILKKTKYFKGDVSPFIMELPAYHLPSFRIVLSSMWERGSSFIKKAGSIILLCTIILWFLSNFGFVDGKLVMVKDLSKGLLANIGNMIAWIFEPLGFGNWQSAVATFTGLIAKENVVGTFGIVYGFAGEVAEDGKEIWGLLSQHFNMISAYSFLAFNLLCAPCFAAIGAIKREMNNKKWTIFAIAYQCILAYASALCIYQIATFITTGIFTVFTFIAFVIVVVFIYLLFRKDRGYNG